MISNQEHLKTQQEKLQMKINLRDQKTLKSKVRKMLPSDYIKVNEKKRLVINEKGQKVLKSVSQAEIAKFYNFSQLTIPQIQKILYNPLYYLQTDRNLRIFKMHLYKTNLIRKLQDLASLNAQKANSVNYRKNILDFQFQDNSKVNYRDPWQYIAKKTDMSDIYDRRNTSSRQRQKQKSLRATFNNNSMRTVKSEPKLSLLKSTKDFRGTVSLKKSLTQRQSSLFKQKIRRYQEGRKKYFNKLSQAQIRLMKLKQQQNQIIKKRSKTLQSRISFAKLKRSRIINSFCEVVQRTQQIRQKCLDTMKSRKQQWQMIKQKKTYQARLRTQKMKAYLQLKLNLNI